MTKSLTILVTTICLICSTRAKADSWFDPSWREMLDSSDVIALVEYTSEGDFRASARVLKTYKGSFKKGDEIWIAGFSNRYGPIDEMHVGDQYLVFMNHVRPDEKRLNYWKEEVVKKPELSNFVEALKAGKVCSVWSPTAGDLKVKRKTVQYDLIQSSYYPDQKFRSLSAFITFLESYLDQGSKKDRHCKELLSELKPASKNDSNAQSLMMLYLLKHAAYDPVFEAYATTDNPSSRFALALLMGNIATDESKSILLTLLKDEHSLVQGEAVRQLSKTASAEVGAILLQRLKDANPQNAGPNNVMNPVMNSMSGGRTQIITTLGEIGYKPAIPELLSLLETKDEYEFTHIVETLRKLGTREYAGYINQHLDNLDGGMILQLCFIISDDSLTECIPSLMNFVKEHDRTIWPTKECAISRHFGLAHFHTDMVKQFLIEDFLTVMKMPDTYKEAIDTKQKWVEEYLSSFTHLNTDTHKKLIYDYMYNYYGFNSDFKTNPRYFQRKQELEDSLIRIVGDVLQPIDPGVRITAVALLDSHFKPINYVVKYELSQQDEFYPWGKNTIDTLNARIFSQTSIDEQHLNWSSGNYTILSGGIKIERFSDNFMFRFLDYISTLADQEDIQFLENLKKYNYAKTDFEKEQLDNYLEKAKTRAASRK